MNTKMKVLVVDDNYHMLQGVVECLKDVGFEKASIFYEENFYAATKVLEKKEIDLLITDYQMPGMDDIKNGIDFAEKVKKEYDIPVILMSGTLSDNIIEKGKEIGINEFLYKGFNFEENLQAAISDISL